MEKLLKKIFVISSILFCFVFVNVGPCIGLNYLLLTNDNSYSNKMYQKMMQSKNSFQLQIKNKQMPIVCFKKVENSNNTICLAKKSINNINNIDDSIISKIMEQTENVYDVLIFSNPNIPGKIRQNFKNDITHFKKKLNTVTNQMILDSNKLTESQKQDILNIYNPLTKIDFNNPLALEAKYKNALTKLAKKSVHGYIVKSIDDLKTQLVKDSVVIINRALKEMGFNHDDKVFLTEDHILEQRAIKDYNYFSDNPRFNTQNSNIPSTSHSKNSSGDTVDTSRAIDERLIQHPMNKKYIADPVHHIKNVVDNYVHGRSSSKNPKTTLQRFSGKLENILNKIKKNPNITKVKYSSQFKKMVQVHNRKINKLKRLLKEQQKDDNQ